MDATPIDIGGARPFADGRNPMGIHSPPDRTVPLETTWAAIHDAASTIGTIAGLPRSSIAWDIERGLGTGPAYGNARVDECILDLAEMLSCGIAALLTAHTSGGAPQAAAGALWREFVDTRDALLRDALPADTSEQAG